MKATPLIFLILCATLAFGQMTTWTGIVMDATNGAPVKYANVQFPGSICGTTTNRNGEFTLTGDPAIQKKLIISAISYKTKEILIAKKHHLKIQLTTTDLDTKNNLDQTKVNQIVFEALENIPLNYDSIDYTATSFTREHVKSFNKIIQYFELVSKTRVQNGAETTHPDDAFYMEDKRQRELFWNPASGGFYTFGWSDLNTAGKPSTKCFLGVTLSSNHDLKKVYSFVSKGTVEYDGRTIHVLQFDQNPGIKASLLMGTLFIDSASKAIIKISYASSPKGFHYHTANRSATGKRISKSPRKIEIIRESGEINFMPIGNKWCLASQVYDAEFNASFDSVKAGNNRTHFLKMHSERVVTAVVYPPPLDGQNVVSKKSTISHDYIKNNFEDYALTSERWTRNPSFLPDTALFKVASTLRAHNRLWERKSRRDAKEKLIASTTFSPNELKKDIAYFFEMIEAVHPGAPDFPNNADLQNLRDESIKKIVSEMTEADLIKVLTPVVASLPFGQTKLMQSNVTEAFSKKYGKYFPYNITVVGKKAYLTKDIADSARGNEVVSINGESTSIVLNNLSDKVSCPRNSIKDYFLGKEFQQLYSTYYDQPDTFALVLKDRKTKDVFSHRVASRNIFHSKGDTGLPGYLGVDSLQTGILSIPKISSRNEITDFLKNTFHDIKGKGYSTIIIDLRETDVDDDYFGPLLYSYISSEPFQFYNRVSLATSDTAKLNALRIGNSRLPKAIPDLMTALSVSDSAVHYVKHPNLAVHESNLDFFDGEVLVIVGPGTQSSAAEFASMVATRNRTTIIGQEISTSFYGQLGAGDSYFLLPHTGIRVSIPLAKYILATNTSEPTLIPDHLIPYTDENVIGKKDVEMDFCIRLITENCCTASSN